MVAVGKLPGLSAKSGGSLVAHGSTLIGQAFTDSDGNPIPKYFQSHAQCQLGNCEQVRREMDEIIALIKDAPGYLKNRYTKDCQKACPATP